MASNANADPLLSWLRSIRQVKQAHPDDKTKLLPYVFDCYREFQDSESYHNDPRFLRVCVQLADCSPDSLKIMTELDERGIGHGHTLFYEAYATCLESKRRFGDANNVYKQGLSRQAQPTEKLANSYKLFRERMDARKKRKQRAGTCFEMDEEGSSHKQMEDGGEHTSKSRLLSSNWYTAEGLDVSFEELRLATWKQKACYAEEPCGVTEVGHVVLRPNHYMDQNTSVSSRLPTAISFGEETIQIRNFAAEVITGKEKDVEDVRHHGLVDPTINTKEALQDILSMFCKPLDIGIRKDVGKSLKRQALVSISVLPSSPSIQDKDRQTSSMQEGLQVQPLEFSVFKDDD